MRNLLGGVLVANFVVFGLNFWACMFALVLAWLLTGNLDNASRSLVNISKSMRK